MSSPEELTALQLGGANAAERLASLDAKLKRDREIGFRPQKTGEVNNHIHTIYSFSPYSPAEAAYGAWRAGLEAAGIIDHESVAGCGEMLEAGKTNRNGRYFGVRTSCGCCRYRNGRQEDQQSGFGRNPVYGASRNPS